MNPASSITRRSLAVGLPIAWVAGCAQPGPSAPTWTGKPAFYIVDIQIHDGKAFGEYVAGLSDAQKAERRMP